jgi:hypothetical protein
MNTTKCLHVPNNTFHKLCLSECKSLDGKELRTCECSDQFSFGTNLKDDTNFLALAKFQLNQPVASSQHLRFSNVASQDITVSFFSLDPLLSCI